MFGTLSKKLLFWTSRSRYEVLLRLWGSFTFTATSVFYVWFQSYFSLKVSWTMYFVLYESAEGVQSRNSFKACLKKLIIDITKQVQSSTSSPGWRWHRLWFRMNLLSNKAHLFPACPCRMNILVCVSHICLFQFVTSYFGGHRLKAYLERVCLVATHRQTCEIVWLHFRSV